ncbi:hypothetical protein DSOUD_1361 [Desulfuromonas soudanensis]|uniref:Uncharacterized protein n=1 Tax=Desulfuromonas soudanensis TaxID=1603606 RepID=A0A0M4CW57_9BACT|nr:hypothetical protein DSOUD_1361 [Desulfuromonas soudanensis]
MNRRDGGAVTGRSGPEEGRNRNRQDACETVTVTGEIPVNTGLKSTTNVSQSQFLFTPDGHGNGPWGRRKMGEKKAVQSFGEETPVPFRKGAARDISVATGTKLATVGRKPIRKPQAFAFTALLADNLQNKRGRQGRYISGRRRSCQEEVPAGPSVCGTPWRLVKTPCLSGRIPIPFFRVTPTAFDRKKQRTAANPGPPSTVEPKPVNRSATADSRPPGQMGRDPFPIKKSY